MQTGDALVGFLVPLPVMFQSTPAIEVAPEKWSS